MGTAGLDVSPTQAGRNFVTAELTYPEWARARDELLLATEQCADRSGAEPLPAGFPPGHHLSEADRLWDQLARATRRGVIATELAWVNVAPAPARNGVWYPARIQPQWLQPGPPHGRSHDLDRPRRLNNRRHLASAGHPVDNDEPKPLSTAAAARYLSVDRSVVTHLVAAGTLEPRPAPPPYRFTIEALDACIERCRTYPSSSAPASTGSG